MLINLGNGMEFMRSASVWLPSEGITRMRADLMKRISLVSSLRLYSDVYGVFALSYCGCGAPSSWRASRIEWFVGVVRTPI